LFYFVFKVLPLLVEQIHSFDICTKHGSLLAIGEIIHGLYINHQENEKLINISSDIIKGKFTLSKTI